MVADEKLTYGYQVDWSLYKVVQVRGRSRRTVTMPSLVRYKVNYGGGTCVQEKTFIYRVQQPHRRLVQMRLPAVLYLGMESSPFLV